VSIFLRIVFSAIFVFISPAWGVEPLLIALLIVGISFGISGTAQSTRMMHHSPKENYGDAASLLNIVNYLGSSLGVVAYAMAFIIATPGYAGVTITDIPANVVVSGFNGSAVLGVILAVIALICTLVVRNIVPKNDVKQE
jgi:sugar phosphate permease